MNIFIKTVADFMPMLMLVMTVLTVLNVVIYVATHDDTVHEAAPTRKQLAWDLHHPARFISLE